LEQELLAGGQSEVLGANEEIKNCQLTKDGLCANLKLGAEDVRSSLDRLGGLSDGHLR